LEQLVRLTDLDIGINTPEEKEALFKRLAADISVAPITLNLLTLSYRDRDPSDGQERGAGPFDDLRGKNRGHQPS
jgi:hypothetical protein